MSLSNFLKTNIKLVVNIIRKHLKNYKNISGNQTQLEINRDHITTTP